MTILVTGGAGFIGSAFVRNAVAGHYPALAGAPITVLDKFTYAGNEANLAAVADAVRVVRGDIADPAAVDAAMAGARVVLNFAAETHVDRSIAGANDFVLTNVVGTHALLDGARRHGVQRYLQVSTDEVYGSIDTGSWTEDHLLEPNSPYSAAKAGGDLLALAYGRTYGLDVVVTRCSNNYGPYQYPEKVIPLFVTTLLDGGSVPLYGDGLHVRDWLHVDDHCRGIALALTAGARGQVYNIGGGTELTNRDLTGRLLAATGRGWDSVTTVADRLGHDRRYSVDCTKIAALGYAPQVPFDVGLADTVAWYRNHPQWWRPLRAAATPVLTTPLPSTPGSPDPGIPDPGSPGAGSPDAGSPGAGSGSPGGAPGHGVGGNRAGAVSAEQGSL